LKADKPTCSSAHISGIDLRVRGTRAYRLLDATVALSSRFAGQPGETVRYDIRINRFVRQGETYLLHVRVRRHDRGAVRC
jgi:hypothetical protein